MPIEQVRFQEDSKSPIPLQIDLNRIAVDYNGVLVAIVPSYKPEDQFQLRPGAERLLKELHMRGFTVDLMTDASIPIEVLFGTFPSWRNIFSRIITGRYIQETQQRFRNTQWMQAIAEADPEVFDYLDQILSGAMGGKYPPLFGIGGGIIDDVIAALNFGYQTYSTLLKEYSFPVYSPLQYDSDMHPDAWVDRVLGQIDQGR